MCLATGKATGRLDPDLRTPSTQLNAVLAAAKAPPKPLDADLKQAHQQATRRTSTKGQAMPLASTQQVAANNILAEQQRRDDLRAANERLAEQRRAEVARVGEAQQQAAAQRQAETQRQGELQQQAEQARIAQDQQLGRERNAAQAMSQSMRVLGASTKATVAPAARVTRGNQSRSRVRATAGSQGLRIGESATSAGAGLNIGV